MTRRYLVIAHYARMKARIFNEFGLGLSLFKNISFSPQLCTHAREERQMAAREGGERK